MTEVSLSSVVRCSPSHDKDIIGTGATSSFKFILNDYVSPYDERCTVDLSCVHITQFINYFVHF